MIKKKSKIKNKNEQEPKAVKEMKKAKDKKLEKKAQKEEKKLRKRKKLKRVIIFFIIIIVLIYGIKLGISIHNWKTLAKDMTLNQVSVVVDIDRKEIAKLGSEKKKITITADKIPNNLKDAYVAIEDQRYYSHHGVDFKRTVSAIGSYIINSGSSSFGRKYNNSATSQKSYR